MISTKDKQGRSGQLTFVTVHHEVTQAKRPGVVDEQDLVYLDERALSATMVAQSPVDQIPGAPSDWSIAVNPVLLFRFFALTCNAYRIHYDRDYALSAEKYLGLVVYGPHQALLMVEVVRRLTAVGAMCSFQYRLVSRLFDHEGLSVAATQASPSEHRTTARTKPGRVTATGALELVARSILVDVTTGGNMLSFWKERCDLATALRWAVRLGFQEAIDNHFSLAVPDADGVRSGDRFLVNPWGLHWSEVTASSLLLCNAAGQVLEGDGEVESSAFHIHSPVHCAVPDAPAVFHTHMPYATALAVVGRGRLAMSQQNAVIFWENIAYDDDYNGVALDRDEGARMASVLGTASVLLLAGHGVISVAATVAEALGYLYYFERAAHVQVLAASTGQSLRELSPEVLSMTSKQMKASFEESARAYFEFARRTLAREEPGYLT